MESLLEPRDESACAGDSPLSAWRIRASTNERIARRNERERERERQELEASKLKRSARRSLRLPKEFAYLTTFIIRVFAWQSLLRPRLQSTRIVQHDPRADFVCVGFRNFRNDSGMLFAIPKLSRGSVFSGRMSIWSI